MGTWTASCGWRSPTAFPPIDAVRMVTLNAASSLGVQRDFGSIAPGKTASIAGLHDLHDFEVRMVVSGGVESARDGRYLLNVPMPRYPEAWYDTVHVKEDLEPTDFLFDRDLGAAEVRVIGITPGSLVTADLVENLTFEHSQQVRIRGSRHHCRHRPPCGYR